MALATAANPTAVTASLKASVIKQTQTGSYFLGGKILSTDLGDSVDILAPPVIAARASAAAAAGDDSNEISVTGILTSLALTLGPTALFLSRTPKVVEMMGELNDNNTVKQDEEEDKKKEKKK